VARPRPADTFERMWLTAAFGIAIHRLRVATRSATAPAAVRPQVRQPSALGTQGRFRLFVLSFLMLFLELALIRWTGSEVLYLSYFSNFVLLASFLGLGAGFLRARAKHDLFPLAPILLATLVLFVLLFPVEIERSGEELIYFGALQQSHRALPIWAALPAIFVAVAAVMMTVGQGVARAFVQFEPLQAYRTDITGSLAGIAAFSLLSFAGAPPLAWGLVTAITFGLLLMPSPGRAQIGSLAALVAMLGIQSALPLQVWSPYYRVTLSPLPSGAIAINVNGIPHQTIESVDQRQRSVPLYFLPYSRLRAQPTDVLIVGAGAGTDVAIALTQGVQHVDAVEIDPSIHDLGVELNPNHPFADPRVTSHIDDGRAFLHQTERRYDLILFALPDSLTLVAGQSSLRLESYLFTIEAMREARAHLKPGGVFGEYNYYREQWLIDRLAGTLQAVYGHPPCIDSTGQTGKLALLTAGVDPGAINCPTIWDPESRSVPSPATDDYPFLYLQRPGIPGYYLFTLALIVLAALLLVRLTSGPLRGMAVNADLFCMGAAFLLLETKNVVQFALLFGTTWFVNALVFAGILLAVLAAVTVAQRVRLAGLWQLYLLLLASLAVAWTVPPELLLTLPLFPRFLAASVIAFIPIFAANLVFSQRFRRAGSSNLAFGANLLGAMVGGVLEYSSLAFGYRALLPVIAGLYVAALLIWLTQRPALKSRA
jgi:SAM-dependent methyltransferase